MTTLGDNPPEEFRKQLHELADWIADHREHIEKLRVTPSDEPGAILARLSPEPPEQGEHFEKIHQRTAECECHDVAHMPGCDRAGNARD
jgi:hypothetical protein